MIHLRHATITRRLTVTGIATALALGIPGAAFAAKPGVVTAPVKVVADIVRDTGRTQPAKCFAADQAKSNKRWAAFSFANPLPAGCTPYDGYSVVRKKDGMWESLPIGGSSIDCPDLKSKLRKSGAPKSVFADFKAGGYCVKS